MATPKGWKVHRLRILVGNNAAVTKGLVYERCDSQANEISDVPIAYRLDGEKGWWLTGIATKTYLSVGGRMGAYKTLKQACQVADTMILLDQFPEGWR